MTADRFPKVWSVRSSWQALGLAVLLLAMIAVLNRNGLPAVLVMPSSASAAAHTVAAELHQLRVILPDDVMISLRAAMMQATLGRASLNASELSQPATSYLYPLLLAAFDAPAYPWLMPSAACLFGIGCLLGCAMLLYRANGGAKTGNAALWITMALGNASVLQYAYSGWEHLPQALCLSLAALCVLSAERQGARASVAVLSLGGVACALAFLFRADSAILFGPWLMMAAWFVRARGIRWLAFLASSAFTAGIYLIYQWETFGWLLPTTARLKTGAATDWVANLLYMATNLINGSAVAITLLCACLLVYNRSRLTPMLWAMAASLVLFMAYGLTVSDVFPYARMFIPAGMVGVLAAAVATSSPPDSSEVSASHLRGFLRLGLVLTMIGVVTTVVVDIGRSRLSLPAIRIAHPTIEHTLLAGRLREKLDPEQDTVGLFWLGAASYELRGFDVVDFLGKGDERIARLDVRWGPPGHNKWDIALSLKRWNPAVIIARADAASKPSLVRRQMIAARQPWTFWDALYEDDAVVERYQYCAPRSAREFGLLIRRDVVDRFTDLCEAQGIR